MGSTITRTLRGRGLGFRGLGFRVWGFRGLGYRVGGLSTYNKDFIGLFKEV